MRAWNVCTELDPALAGLYRGIVDFSRALDAPVLSFRRASSGAAFAADVAVSEVACGVNPPGYSGLFVGASARRMADRIVANPDLLVVHSLFRGHVVWAHGHARRRGTQLWAVPHGCLDPWGLRQRWAIKRAWLAVYGERFLEDASVTVFATQRERQKALAWTRSKRTAVIPWPVRLPNLDGRDSARHRFRTLLALPESAILLLYAGRLHSMKRPRETIAAFCEAATADIHLVMAGGEGDVTTGQLVGCVPPSLREQVHLLGSLHGADLHDAWLAADGFISLSHRENFGYSFAEALGYGLPAIVSPGHDLAWDLPFDSDGTWPHGWLLPDDSHGTAVAAILDFIRNARNSTLARRTSEAARNWVAEMLSPDLFQRRLYDLQ